MRKILLPTVLLACTLGLSSCAGTLTATVAGPLAGGSSLTAHVYKSESSTAVKILTTPFSFAAGTLFGWWPSFIYGFRYDFENYPTNEEKRQETTLANVWDPFSGFSAPSSSSASAPGGN